MSESSPFVLYLFPLRFLNDQPIETGVHFTVDQRKGLTGDIVHSLSIDVTQVEDIGTVKAVATNKAGEATTDARLDVEGKGNDNTHPCCKVHGNIKVSLSVYYSFVYLCRIRILNGTLLTVSTIESLEYKKIMFVKLDMNSSNTLLCTRS